MLDCYKLLIHGVHQMLQKEVPVCATFHERICEGLKANEYTPSAIAFPYDIEIKMPLSNMYLFYIIVRASVVCSEASNRLVPAHMDLPAAHFMKFWKPLVAKFIRT